MSKVNFERIQASIPDDRHMLFIRDFIRCDLARPAPELAIIACLLATQDWIRNAAEHDGAIYLRDEQNAPWMAIERSLHQALNIARKYVTEAILALKTRPIPSSVTPIYVSESDIYQSGPKAIVWRHESGTRISDRGGMYHMPKDCCEQGFAVHRNEDGSFSGYFLKSPSYDSTPESIAVNLLKIVNPQAGITAQKPHRFDGIGIANPTDGLADLAVMCMKYAQTIIVQYKEEIKALQWEGKPSVFTDEDDDARDLLVQEVRNGAIIHQVVKDDSCHYDIYGRYNYTLSDGTELSAMIVRRLINSRILICEGDPFAAHKEGEPLPSLILNPKAKETAFIGRTSAVRFKSFESYCSKRRYDNHTECAHPSSRSDYCSARSCPLLMQVYSEDVGYGSYQFEDDPAFDSYDWDRDPLVRALHPNTTRSYAWRASGEEAIVAVTNQMLRSHFGLGIERHMFGKENERAVLAAVEAGYLIIDERLAGFGMIVRASQDLIKKMETQISESEKHQENENA